MGRARDASPLVSGVVLRVVVALQALNGMATTALLARRSEHGMLAEQAAWMLRSGVPSPLADPMPCRAAKTLCKRRKAGGVTRGARWARYWLCRTVHADVSRRAELTCSVPVLVLIETRWAPRAKALTWLRAVRTRRAADRLGGADRTERAFATNETVCVTRQVRKSRIRVCAAGARKLHGCARRTVVARLVASLARGLPMLVLIRSGFAPAQQRMESRELISEARQGQRHHTVRRGVSVLTGCRWLCHWRERESRESTTDSRRASSDPEWALPCQADTASTN
jgi:hypothetical protein